MNNLVNEIQKYANYPDNWDGEGAKAPAKENISILLTLISNLPDTLSLPTPMLFNDGRLGLYWNNNNYYIDIEIENSESFSIFGRNKRTNEELFDEDVLVNPISVQSVINRYTSELK